MNEAETRAIITWDKIYLWRKNAAKKRRRQVIRRKMKGEEHEID